MPLILNIETATNYASVCISNDSEVIAIEHNSNPKDHASFIQPAIKRLLLESNYLLSSVDAIAISAGPGSYTGLRVGLSTAKGLCYALNKPLILINTLQAMALASVENSKKDSILYSTKQSVLYCPMIDARRMEVFTALYDESLNLVKPPAAVILDENSFSDELKHHIIIVSGSGSNKFKILNKHANIIYSTCMSDASHLIFLAQQSYQAKKFSDLVYCEPFYLKAFHNTQAASTPRL